MCSVLNSHTCDRPPGDRAGADRAQPTLPSGGVTTAGFASWKGSQTESHRQREAKASQEVGGSEGAGRRT